jgi:uncharacterized protein (DUF1499 family)
MTLNRLFRLPGLIKAFLPVVVMALASGCAGQPLNKPPVIEPCPKSPNCVSSISNSTVQGVEPFTYVEQDAKTAWKAVRAALEMEKRVKIIRETGSYLYAECRTLLGFVDDLEFMAEPENSLIHVRSASRTGYWDLGVNSRRINRIRDRFTMILKEQHKQP